MPCSRAALRPAGVALLLLALGAGPALPQPASAPVVSTTAPGSLPPPRPLQPAPLPAASPPPANPAPRPPAAQPPQVAPQATPRPAPPASTPSAPARPPQGEARPAQGQTGTQPRPPQGQSQARPPAQPPAVGAQPAPANRRPPPGTPAAGAAAAGAAAGAAGVAAAASRTPEPAQPAPPPGPLPLPAPSTGQVSGLPIPRFASLRSDQVNMRVGPNTTFPIEWTFQRRDLPVMIVGEFQVWRRVRDADGAEGWVHQSTLAGRRTALVRPAGTAPEITLRRRGEESAAAVARLRGGVIARIRECAPASAWCEVQVATHRGYLRRADVWGLLPDEEVK
jgi:SH3-like domain-containing protein